MKKSVQNILTNPKAKKDTILYRKRLPKQFNILETVMVFFWPGRNLVIGISTTTKIRGWWVKKKLLGRKI